MTDRVRYRRTVTPAGEDEWVVDPNGTHWLRDLGYVIEMIPVPPPPVIHQPRSKS